MRKRKYSQDPEPSDIISLDSIDNSDSVLVDMDEKDAHTVSNVQHTVYDYVDGKVCLICDIELQSPIIAIKHAKTNHLDIINPVSLHIHDFPLFSLAKGSNSLCFDHKFPLEHQIIWQAKLLEIYQIFTLENCTNSVDRLQSGINNAQISLVTC
mgnify:FL=1